MRKNVKRVKNINGMNQIMLDLMPKRCDADVYVNRKMDVTNLVKYVDKKKKEGLEITYFHAMVAAIAKVFYNRPKLNYFIANRHVYEHTDVVISFVAKVEFEDSSEEIMIMIPVKENDTMDDISKTIKAKVDAVRNKTGSKKGANSAIDTLGKLPNIIRKPLVGIFKWMDDKGILPSSLCEDNLYYSSIIVSNLGTFNFGAIYHHLTDFGTCSALGTIGAIEDVNYKDENGKDTTKKMCEFGISFDERIADGFYFINSCKLLEYIFEYPEELDKPSSEKVIRKNK